MRIGIDSTPIFLPKGGIGYYTFYLLEALTRLDSENEYILFTTSPISRESDNFFISRPNIKVIQTHKALQKWHCLREKIDLYHGTNFRLRGKGRYGNVITIHDLAFKYYPNFLKKKFGQFLSFLKTKRDVEKADRIIAVSQSTANDIVRFFKIDPNKIRVIYHGVEANFRPDIGKEAIEKVKRKYQILTAKYILWVGTIEPRKNISSLIKMYQQLETLHGDYSLVLGGKYGWKYEEILPLVQSFSGKIIVTGYLPKEDLIPLYAGADLFIFPSLYEGFGMPLLEAMASGVPIITSKTSAMPEVVGDAALLIDPLNIQEMSQAVLSILEKASLRSLLQKKGIERAKKFSWEKAAVETLNIYREIYRNRKG